MVPRVGNLVLRDDHTVFPMFQMLTPEMNAKLILVCRGTDRFRVPGSFSHGEEMPWRKTVIVDRNSGAVVDLGPPENWQKPFTTTTNSKLRTRKAVCDIVWDSCCIGLRGFMCWEEP